MTFTQGGASLAPGYLLAPLLVVQNGYPSRYCDARHFAQLQICVKIASFTSDLAQSNGAL
jgi:hypothetical protein